MSLRQAFAATLSPPELRVARTKQRNTQQTGLDAQQGAQQQSQLPAVVALKTEAASATAGATRAQPGSCAPPFRQGAATQHAQHPVQSRGVLTTADRLRAAINQACLERGDSEANRHALLAEALALPLHQQTDLAEHFDQVAQVWRQAKRGVTP